MNTGSVKAELKRIHSPDVADLKEFRPNGPFGLLVQVMVGPMNMKGEESFDIIVCSPSWFEGRMMGNMQLGRHHLFMKNYDYEGMLNFIRAFVDSCQDNSWPALAQKLGRLGKWEFDDYQPFNATK